MNKKILIIGQAPPAKPQAIPYDSTLLYFMLQWVGINKVLAQQMFEFEALTDQFPGKTQWGAHKAPSKKMCMIYWESTLKAKVYGAEKIICLGRVADAFLMNRRMNDPSIAAQFLYLPHPSRRNYHKIMNKERDNIKIQLCAFLF